MSERQFQGVDAATAAYLRDCADGAPLRLSDVAARIAAELRAAENAAAEDYLGVEPETRALASELERTDKALADIESTLLSFRKSLASARSEMSALQQKSQAMHTELENRRQIAAEFSEFAESVLIEPRLIEELLKGELNEDFRANVQCLHRKLAGLKRYDRDFRVLREIEPELFRLRARVSDRIRTHLNALFAAFKKPNTNFQILQKSIESDRLLVFFLKEHATDVYLELCQSYSRQLSRLYTSNLKIYFADLSKLLGEQYLQRLALFPDSRPAYASAPGLGERAAALGGQTPLIVAHAESRRFQLEEVFAAVNELVLSSAREEFGFCQRFFGLLDEECALFFLLVFRPAFLLVIERLRAWAAAANDIYSLLLMQCVLAQSEERFQQFEAAAQYFAQIEAALSARVDELFAAICQEIANANAAALPGLARAVGEAALLSRVAAFLSACDAAAAAAPLAKALAPRLAAVTEATLSLLARAARTIGNAREESAFALKCLEALAAAVQQTETFASTLSPPIRAALAAANARLAELLVEEHFPRLATALHSNSALEETVQDFRANWRVKLANLKAEAEHRLGRKSELTARVLRLASTRLLDLYAEFFNCVKSALPLLVGQLPLTHRLSLDLHASLSL